MNPEPYGTTPLPTEVSSSPVKVVLNVSEIAGDGGSRSIQQPQTQLVASYEAQAPDPHDCWDGTGMVDVNQHFVVYAVKNGLIRVLHRHSPLKELLRGHTGQRISDMRFFENGDILATASFLPQHNTNFAMPQGKEEDGLISRIFIWRLFEGSHEIRAEILLEIQSKHFLMKRILWHPFDTNQFWMIHTSTSTTGSTSLTSLPSANGNVSVVATLVESTRISTVPSSETGNGSIHNPEKDGLLNTVPHRVCHFHQDRTLMEGAIRIETPLAASASSTDKRLASRVMDLCWSGRDTRHVLTVHDSGHIILWDCRSLQASSSPSLLPPHLMSGDFVHGMSATVSPTPLVTVLDHGLEEGNECEQGLLTRCLFLPHDQAVRTYQSTTTAWTSCFLTARHNNAVITLWSAFTSDLVPPMKLQILDLQKQHPLPSLSSNSYLLEIGYGPSPPNASPPACFLLATERSSNSLMAFHLSAQWSQDHQGNINGRPSLPKTTETLATVGLSRAPPASLLVGCNYVVPFVTRYPTFAWRVMCEPTADIANNIEDEDDEAVNTLMMSSLTFDMNIFAYQSGAVQSMTLTSYMCLPPSSSWTVDTPGIVDIVRLDPGIHSAHVSDIASEDVAMQYDEDYQVEDEVGEDEFDPDLEEEADPLEPSSNAMFASPNGPGTAVSLANNPFANWLGAIAARTATAPDVPTQPISTLPPPGLAPPATHVTPTTTTLLSPMDLIQPSGADHRSAAETRAPSVTKVMQAASESSTEGQRPVTKATPSREKKSKSNAGSHTAPALTPVRAGDGKISILKREADLPVSVAPTVPKETPAARTSDSFVASKGQSLAKPPQAPTPSFSEEILRRVVREEIMDAFIPAVREMLQQSLQSVVVEPIRASVEKLASEGITIDHEKLAGGLAEHVDDPLREAVADSLKTAWVPAFESLTGQMFEQLSDHLARGETVFRESQANHLNDARKGMDSFASQLSALTSLVADLSTELSSMRAVIERQQEFSKPPSDAISGGGQPMTALVDPMEAFRQEVLSLLKTKQYEAAFTKAVAASTSELVVFCCRHADLNDVLGGSSPQLSQPILLCVMQQLGTVLVSESDLQLELEWLQEIALSLNPKEEGIQRHVPAVLHQLVASINQRMMQGEAQLRRPLQRLLQIVRGMLMA